MPDKNVLTEVFSATAREMRAQFEKSAAIEHRGSKGTVREDKLLSFLQDYLPKNVAVAGSSEIIALNGERSGQMDIVIYDPAAPPLFHEEGYRILPAECVYAVIEVKSHLSWDELRKSAENIAKVKRLPKTAYHPQPFSRTRNMYGQEYIGYCPTVGFVFAYDSADLRAMSDKYIGQLLHQPVNERLDSVWVLGKGAYSWMIDPQTDMKAVPAAHPGAWLAIGDAVPDGDVLIHMMLTLDTHCVNAYMPPFDMIQYATNVEMFDNVNIRGPIPYKGPAS
ncbi:DUF6602 domain-containing protein [Pseudonocardia sp. RS010]|uniref:DUF6602 domain-containing protein n=1 Tax=Pseudonocardia sp. RS010 TaxID=3385979 RepID=UPI0039A06B5F